MVTLDVSKVQQDLLPIRYGGRAGLTTWASFPRHDGVYYMFVSSDKGYSVRYGGAVAHSNCFV
jgi:hypothetical protein